MTMRERRLTMCGWDRRRWKMFIVVFITLSFFGGGLFFISSVITIAERQSTSIQLVAVQEEERDPIQTSSLSSSSLKILPIPERRILKEEYEYYFRIDYKIIQGVCKPIYLFNASTTVISLQNLTNSILNLITQRVTIETDIISINPVLLKTDKIRQNSTYKFLKSVCSYALELYIGINFPTDCNNSCQSQVIERLSAKIRPFGDPVDYLFTFNFYSPNSFESRIKYRIEHISIFRSSIYFDKLVYICSYYEVRYVSALILDSSAHHTSVTMSEIDRTLFYIKSGLEQQWFRTNVSTIHISFLTSLAHNTYLRHEIGRIKLRKTDQTSLFNRDATFRIVTSNTTKDMMAFQSINVPQSYLAVDSDMKTSLVLVEPESNVTTIDTFEKRFLFKLILDS